MDPWRHYKRECTSFAAWCLVSRNGLNAYPRFPFAANAKDWDDECRKLGYIVDRNPAVGSIAYWESGTYGHVAWVADVDGENITIQEYNYDYKHNYNERTIKKWNPAGFIHIKDIPHRLDPPSTSANIPNGDYAIISALSPRRGVSYEGNGDGNGQNVFLNDIAGTGYSVWTLERQADNSYIVKSKNGKLLDVNGGPTAFGDEINVHLYQDMGYPNQRWYIIEEQGGYKFIAKHSGYALDVQNADTFHGNNIWQYRPNSSLAQVFRLEEVPKVQPLPVSSDPSIKDGSYIIHSKMDQNKVVSVDGGGNGSNVILWENNVHDSRIWYLRRHPDGSYMIQSKFSNNVLDVSGSYIGNWINVGVYNGTWNANQRWYIISNGDGTHKLVAKHSGYVLDIMEAKTENGANVQQYIWHNHDAQRFILERYPAPTIYMVTFKGKDGSVLRTVNVEAGDSVTAPQAPQVEGYSFTGWDKSLNNIQANTEIKAVYTANPVVENNNSGTNGGSNDNPSTENTGGESNNPSTEHTGSESDNTNTGNTGSESSSSAGTENTSSGDNNHAATGNTEGGNNGSISSGGESSNTGSGNEGNATNTGNTTNEGNPGTTNTGSANSGTNAGNVNHVVQSGGTVSTGGSGGSRVSTGGSSGGGGGSRSGGGGGGGSSRIAAGSKTSSQKAPAASGPAKSSGTWSKGSKGWIYTKENHVMAKSEWMKISEKWYFFNAEGFMATGWIQYNSIWYYMIETAGADEGKMATGWIDWKGKKYYLSPEAGAGNGAMLRNTMVEGYRLGDDGARQ